MNSRQFYEAVKEMRQWQKEYFRTRNHVALNRSKIQEKKIDEEIDRVEKILKGNTPPLPFENM